MKRIAYVNNDLSENSAVDANFLTADCSIEIIRNAKFALDIFQRKMPDLVVINLPTLGLDAVELLKAIRQRSMIPVIMRGESVGDIVHIIALHYGVDDFIGKSMSPRFLAERIKAIFRRHEDLMSASRNFKMGERVVAIGNLVMDPPRHEVRWKDQQVELTSTEFQMLLALAQNPGHVKSRDQLMSAAYPDEVYLDERTIDSHIKRLRRKFKLIDTNFSVIETLYGVGYRFNDIHPEDQAQAITSMMVDKMDAVSPSQAHH